MTADTHHAVREEGTVLGAFEKSCQRHADQVALWFLGRKFRYHELRELMQRFAAGVRRLGVGPGDRVLLYLPNSPQWIITYLGLQYLGAVPVPVSPIYTPRELVFLVQHSEAEVVVCADTNFGYVRALGQGSPVRHIVVSGLCDLLPWWKRAIGRVLDRVPTGRVGHGSGVHSFRELLRHRPLEPAPSPPAPTALAHLLYTGGTTGFPKGVPHTHRELLSGIVGLREMYREALVDGENVLVVALPLFHMFTQDMLFALGLHRGNTVVLLPKPLTDAVLSAVATRRKTLLIGVPALYRRLLDNKRLDFYDLSSLSVCWSAGDVLPQETAAAWRTRTDLPIHQVYGSTETVCISATGLDREPQPPAMGHVIETREVRVVDPGTLHDVNPDTPGELLVGSPYSYECGGYWHDAEETARTYVRLDDRLWCRTGDIVSLRWDGQLVFVDRRADMIKHKGYRIAASRVESILLDHPAVTAAAVVGVPDPLAGEVVKAFVILDEAVRGVTAFDLVRHCRERLLPYEVPEYIEFRDMLPKSKVGKLLRRELKAEERRRAGGP